MGDGGGCEGVKRVPRVQEIGIGPLLHIHTHTETHS